jgi:RHS repeat-associated protein
MALIAEAPSQVSTGTPPFGSFASDGFGTINLGNLNEHFEFPIRAKPGRSMPFTYTLSYDSSVWSPVTTGTTKAWQPVLNWGWRGQTEVAVGYISSKSQRTKCSPPDVGYQIVTSGYVYHDMFGVAHNFSGEAVVDCQQFLTGFTELANDDSGFTLKVQDGTGSTTVTAADGKVMTPPLNAGIGNGTARDANGNTITVNGSTFTDTLGQTVLTAGTAGSPASTTFTYTSPSGLPATYTLHYSYKTVQTWFQCGGISEYGPTQVAMVDELDLPDGTKYLIRYEHTPSNNNNVTGRISSITLPNGGVITYTYTNGGLTSPSVGNGIACADGSTPGLSVTTPDTPQGQPWGYQRAGADPTWTTTVTTPNGDSTQLTFNKGGQNFYEGLRTVTDHTLGLLETVKTCYTGPCNNGTISVPISFVAVKTQLPDSTGKVSEVDTWYNSGGLPTEIDHYDFGSGGRGPLLRKDVIQYASISGILDRQWTVTAQDGSGTQQAKTTYYYDLKGNTTSIGYWVSPSSALSKSFAYNNTGTVQSTTDFNSAQSTYTYDPNCANGLLTKTTLPTGNSRSQTWNCQGGVVTSATDENGNGRSYTHSDPYFWRVNATTDELQNQTALTYTSADVQGGIPQSVQSALNFSTATNTVLTTFDSLGRQRLSQQLQAPGASTYDSTETDYDSLGRAAKTTLPFASGKSVTNSGAPGTTTTYDALGRPVVVSDSGGGSVNYSYVQNDVLVTINGNPAGENPKRRQLEYDSLGRLKSVCELTSASGATTCSQSSSQTGYFTQYGYDVLGNITSVSQSGQTRMYTYDGLSRMTSESNPETGTITYIYDSDPTCGTSYGDLVKKKFEANGNTICYSYDALHRVASVTYPSGPNASATAEKHFVYDAATVNGVAMANTKGRLAEAYTGSPSGKISDIGYSYSKRGEVTDIYAATPHSGGYYHIVGQYWANGAVSQLSLPGVPTISYGVDGEGRINTATASSGQNPVISATYNYVVAPKSVTVNLGSGDSDTLSLDANTNRATQYKVTINSQSLIGNLGWNANGSLASLGITDPFNASDNQNCSFSYDDVARISNVNCGSPWGQDFRYDAVGNIFKTVPTGSDGITFDPSSYSLTNNQPTGVGQTFDATGNLTQDVAHTYSWDADGHLVNIDSIVLTYDALGRMAEQNRGGTYTQIVYAASGGKVALMNGQTLNKAFVPLPVGGTAVYTSSGLSYYRHPDWLGSSRLASTPSRGIYSTSAYAPFGEPYAESGSTDRSFTHQNQDTVTDPANGLYDFLFREYHPTSGRWISPDPAGITAVDAANPQTWNRYGYVSNSPLDSIDPDGLCSGAIAGISSGPWAGGGNRLLGYAIQNGMDIAFPFAGGTKLGGAMKVGFAGGGGSAADVSRTMISDVQSQTSQTGGLSGYVLWSGGAVSGQRAGIDPKDATIPQVYASPGGANLDSGSNPNFLVRAGSGFWDSLVNGTNTGPSDYSGTPGAGHDAFSILTNDQNSGQVANTMKEVKPCTQTRMFLPAKSKVGRNGRTNTVVSMGGRWYIIWWSCWGGGGVWVCHMIGITPL